MKSLEEIKNEVAEREDHVDWEYAVWYCCERNLPVHLNGMVNQVIEMYTKQRCDEQIKACAEEYVKPFEGMQRERVMVILNTPNVVTTK